MSRLRSTDACVCLSKVSKCEHNVRQSIILHGRIMSHTNIPLFTGRLLVVGSTEMPCFPQTYETRLQAPPPLSSTSRTDGTCPCAPSAPSMMNDLTFGQKVFSRERETGFEGVRVCDWPPWASHGWTRNADGLDATRLVIPSTADRCCVPILLALLVTGDVCAPGGLMR